MSEPIGLEVDSGLARITLNRPERMNAFDEAAAHVWRDVTREATTRSDVGAILLTGSGRSFCAGGDVRAMADIDSGGPMVELAGVIGDGILALTESSVPVVAAVQGAAAGGGLGIMLTADWIVAAEDARFGCLYAKMGLTPDLSVTASLAAAIGERRALRLVLSDEMIDAATALDWGLVTETTPADRIVERAEEVARGWLAGATSAYGEAKRLIRSRPERTFREQLDEEARTIGRAFETPDAQARIAAFG